MVPKEMSARDPAVYPPYGGHPFSPILTPDESRAYTPYARGTGASEGQLPEIVPIQLRGMSYRLVYDRVDIARSSTADVT
jgi:hypothetical protein